MIINNDFGPYVWRNQRRYINLILTVMVLSIIKQVRGVCCLSFSGLVCIKCPKDMHLYNGNCLNNKPNCLIYQDGFQCSFCNTDYILDNITKECVPIKIDDVFAFPNNGFVQLPSSQYGSILIQNLTTAVRNFYQHTLQAKIQQTAKIYVRRENATEYKTLPADNQNRYYKFIFYTDQGLFEVTSIYIVNGTRPAIFRSLKNVTLNIAQNEDYILWKNYPDREKIENIIYTRYPEVTPLEILEVYRSMEEISPNITESTVLGRDLPPIFNYVYRFIFVNPNSGLFDIYITISDPLTEIIDIQQLYGDVNIVMARFSQTLYTKLLTGAILTNLTLTQGIYNATYTHVGLDEKNLPISYITFYIAMKGNVVVGDRYFFLDSNASNTSMAAPKSPAMKNDGKSIMNITNLEIIGSTIKRLTKEKDRKTQYDRIKANKLFQETYNFIMARNGFYLKGLELWDLKQKSVGLTSIIFNLTFVGKTSGFLISAQIDATSNTTKILDTSLLTLKDLYPQGCIRQTEFQKDCLECSKDYLLYPKDKSCYKKIKNCQFQVGELCLACFKSFIQTNNYQCI